MTGQLMMSAVFPHMQSKGALTTERLKLLTHVSSQLSIGSIATSGTWVLGLRLGQAIGDGGALPQLADAIKMSLLDFADRTDAEVPLTIRKKVRWALLADAARRDYSDHMRERGNPQELLAHFAQVADGGPLSDLYGCELHPAKSAAQLVSVMEKVAENPEWVFQALKGGALQQLVEEAERENTTCIVGKRVIGSLDVLMGSVAFNGTILLRGGTIRANACNGVVYASTGAKIICSARGRHNTLRVMRLPLNKLYNKARRYNLI